MPATIEAEIDHKAKQMLTPSQKGMIYREGPNQISRRLISALIIHIMSSTLYNTRLVML